MTKEGEGVAGAIKSLQAMKESQQNLQIRRWELREDGSKSGKHDPTMSRRRGYVQHDGWRNDYGTVVKVRNVVYDESLSNKLYLNKQLDGLRMMEGTTVLEHLNFFNKVISELLAVKDRRGGQGLDTS